jgi:hypothetical protein
VAFAKLSKGLRVLDVADEFSEGKAESFRENSFFGSLFLVKSNDVFDLLLGGI